MSLIFKYEIEFEASDDMSMREANEVVSKMVKSLANVRVSCESISLKKDQNDHNF